MTALPTPGQLRWDEGRTGTRGEIDARNDRHRRHTSTEVSYRGRQVLVDAGEDWRGLLEELSPRAIIVTHAHPDHAWPLKDGSPVPVWATGAAWEEMEDYPIPEDLRRTVEPREPFESVEGIVFEAFTVEHSIRAPAVGYRGEAGRVTIFYAPDLVYIHEREEALRGCSVDIDHATAADGIRHLPTTPVPRRRSDPPGRARAARHNSRPHPPTRRWTERLSIGSSAPAATDRKRRATARRPNRWTRSRGTIRIPNGRAP